MMLSYFMKLKHLLGGTTTVARGTMKRIITMAEAIEEEKRNLPTTVEDLNVSWITTFTLETISF